MQVEAQLVGARLGQHRLDLAAMMGLVVEEMGDQDVGTVLAVLAQVILVLEAR